MAEAKSLFRLYKRGESTIESIRDLIRVSDSDRQQLAKITPRLTINAVCSFRAEILKVFDGLVATAAATPQQRKPIPPRKRRHSGWHAERRRTDTSWKRQNRIAFDVEEIRRLIAEGIGVPQIAERFRVSDMRILRRLQRTQNG